MHGFRGLEFRGLAKTTNRSEVDKTAAVRHRHIDLVPEIPHRPLSSSFLGLPYRILNINHKKELLRGPWV